MSAAAAPSAAGRARRRVAVVLPVHCSALMGGAQYQAKLLVEHVASAYAADVRYFTVRTDAAFIPRGYSVEQFARPGGLHRFGYFMDAVPLYRALDRFRPDVVYQQVGCALTGIAAYYARRRGATMLWRVSSDASTGPAKVAPWRLDRAAERALLDYGIRHADVILAQTRQQKVRLAEHFGRDDAIVLPNFHPYPAEPIVKAERDKLVMWLANVKRLKNPLAFVRLARRFADRSDVTFLMAGAMMERGRLHGKLSRALAAAPNVRYLGARPQDEVNALLASAHVLVNTSDYEGFSNAFIQAWLREVPVVSLSVDPDGLLSGSGLGYVSRTEERMYADVKRLLDEGELRERIGERCRTYALRQHSPANMDEIARLMGLQPLAPHTPRPPLAAALPPATDVPLQAGAART